MHLAPNDPHRPRLTLNPRDGTFSGSFLHGDGHRRNFKGVLVPQPGPTPELVEGCLTSGPTAGRVEILPGTVGP